MQSHTRIPISLSQTHPLKAKVFGYEVLSPNEVLTEARRLAEEGEHRRDWAAGADKTFRPRKRDPVDSLLRQDFVTRSIAEALKFITLPSGSGTR